MPTKNNHINVNVKNVIKLDHMKKKTKRKRQKNKTNKISGVPISLVRPNNSVYDPNAITFRTGGSIQYPTINKSGYDMKPRIGFGVDPNSDTTSTNITQQLLSEYQKNNDEKTNQKFIDYYNHIDNEMQTYHDKLIDGMKVYHSKHIAPLKNDIHILQSDFDSYKTSTNPKINYPLEEENRNDETNDESNNNRYLEYKDPYFTFPDIYNKKNADNSDAKENYPILTSNNADIFSPPPFAEFVSNNFQNPNLNKDFEVQSVDEDDDEDELPKNDAIVETVLVPQYLKLINNLEMFKFINKNEGLNIDTTGMRNDELRKKIMEKLKLAGKSSSIVYLPADKLTDKQIADGEKIKQKKGKL
jgi:hypothetical protein